MTDEINQFCDAIRSFGLEPPNTIVTGKIYRFPGIGKRNGNKAGWCQLFSDGLGGCFGDWSSGLSEHWQVSQNKLLTPREQDSFQRHVAVARAKAEAEQKARHNTASLRAVAIWKKATPVNGNHTYLVRKGIQPYGVRIQGRLLLIPLRIGDKLHSIQFIEADGKKRFMTGGRVKGCYFLIGNFSSAKTLSIAEGFATGATIHQATGYPVAVAFNAGNLLAVAKSMRERFPKLPIILCADDDAIDGNPGITKATEASQAVGGLLAVPDFGKDRPDGVTDFNDLAALSGLEVVRHAIESAISPAGEKQQATEVSEPWPDPLSLISKAEPEPYPLDALPPTVRLAVEEVQSFTKAPFALVTSSALAALSLAIQAHFDVIRAVKLFGPVGLFLLTIADSGERKSTCDGFFMTAIKEYQQRQAELAKPTIFDYCADLATWEAKRLATIDVIRQATKNEKATVEKEATLLKLESNKPKAPRIPMLLRGDETPENLAWVLSHEWPSGGVVSAEAGIIFGAHGMGKDSIMRNLALLNILWDGGTLSIGRRTSDSFTVRGARLTVALQIQEATLRSFFDRSGGLARGTGFLSRFLIACPESTQGSRFFTDPPENWPALEKFNLRISELLDQPALLDDEGALTPSFISFTPEAKAAWVSFHDTVEIDLASGGKFYDVRDVASKTADNAARLATLFQVFENGTEGAIGLEAINGACKIAGWHLNEARRFFGEFSLPMELANSARLDRWLVEYCGRKQTLIVPRRKVQRNITPVCLRSKAALDEALSELCDAGRVRLVQNGNRKEIHLNPALFE